MHYSTSTGGFYDPTIHGDGIPADAVLITDQDYAALCAGQSRGQAIVADTDGYPVLAEQPLPSMDYAASLRIATLSADCEAAITGGFMSEALGTPHAYQSDRDDQLNLVGAVSANADIPFKCLDGNTGIWAYRPHTAAQLKQVLADGAAVKLQHLQRFGLLRDQVQSIVAATTLLPDDPDYMDDATARAALDTVVW
jgi:hypothetical protein